MPFNTQLCKLWIRNIRLESVLYKMLGRCISKSGLHQVLSYTLPWYYFSCTRGEYTGNHILCRTYSTVSSCNNKQWQNYYVKGVAHFCCNVPALTHSTPIAWKLITSTLQEFLLYQYLIKLGKVAYFWHVCKFSRPYITMSLCQIFFNCCSKHRSSNLCCNVSYAAVCKVGLIREDHDFNY